MALLTAWPAAACRLEQVAELAVADEAGGPVVAGQVDGKPVSILIDTGSLVSAISLEAAHRLGLRVTPMNGVRLSAVSDATSAGKTGAAGVSLGQRLHARMAFAVNSEAQAEAWAADVVLGEDFLSSFDMEFDLPGRVVRLLRERDCQAAQLVYWAKAYSQATLLASSSDDPQMTTTVELNGRPAAAIVDSGAKSSAVSFAAAQAAGVTPRSPVPANGRDEAWIGRFDTLSVGDETIRNAALPLAEISRRTEGQVLGSDFPHEAVDPMAVVIGADFFRSHRVLISPEDHVMVFTYSGGPVFQAVRGNEAK